jgi:DNA-binding MarR family transcriptional regulator
MAREQTARDQSPKKQPAAPTAAPGEAVNALDRLIHERKRLALVSVLAVNESLSFNGLKELLEMSDGNLSVHTQKLEAAGYIVSEKGFDGRMPRTVYRLTPAGLEALNRYLAHMEAITTAVRKRR